MDPLDERRHLRLGVDVGGTNTDAVLLDLSARNSTGRGVLAFQKSPTTSPNVADGIESALQSVISQAGKRTDEISCVVIGTTHFINAIVEHDHRWLSKVAIIRLSKSFTKEVPPFSDFPPELAEIMNGYYGYVDGGLHIDGSEESPVDDLQVVEQCKLIKSLSLSAVVVSGVFSPIDITFNQENRVKDIIKRELPDVDVVCSSEVSNIGFLERENASILNASILKLARRTVKGFEETMQRLNLKCPMFLSQNDGTVIDAATAMRLPVRTFSSGPTNSMRGAAYLGHNTTAEDEERCATIVCDVGGTTTDVGVLLPSGYPRQASAYTTIAGVNVNFAMPHVASIGLGGGSVVRVKEKKVEVGPDSVGHLLTTMSKVFGGNVLTTTDISAAAGADIGSPSLVEDITTETIEQAQKRIKYMLEAAVDTMKMSPAPIPVILVGGGSVVCPTSLEGVSRVVIPPFHGVANAIGAAISKVSGNVDLVQDTARISVQQALENAKALAIDRAVAAGAIRSSVTIAEVDVMPLQYITNKTRFIIRAVGDLSLDLARTTIIEKKDCSEEDWLSEASKQYESSLHVQSLPVDVDSYQPKIVKSKKTGHPEWHISEIDAEWLADGCYLLGCAGGGSPKAVHIKLRDELRAGHTIRVIDSSALAPDANIFWGGNMGSPAVSVERLAQTEVLQAIAEMLDYLRQDSFDAVMGLEIGGANGLEPLLIGSSKSYDRPIIDADFMGRAYPTYWQTTICVYESGQLTPCAIASGDGKSMIMTKAPNDEIVDRALRASCAEMGSRVGMAARPTTTSKVLKYGVSNTLSLAWRIGRVIASAKQHSTQSTVVEQIIDAIGGSETAKILFRGKIVDVERRLYKGHSYGEITIRQTLDSELESVESVHATAIATGGILKIPFKNENIYAKHVAENGVETYVAMVPDLICVLDSQSGKALGVPEFRYGLMVTVAGITCSPRWTDTPRGLEIGGPCAFGFDELKYSPLGEYIQPRSVVLEYDS